MWTQATRRVMSLESNKLKALVKKYMELQHDIDVEMIKAYDHQIEEFIAFTKKKDKDVKELEYARKLLGDLPEIKRKKDELVKMVGSAHIAELEEDQEPMSLIDEMNQNLQNEKPLSDD